MTARRDEWRPRLPATLEAIEELCAEFRPWFATACSPLSTFQAELLLRESLTNAVLHGCAGDPRKQVSCVLRVKPGRLLIAIQDAGEGFDWRAVWNRSPDVSAVHGRGVEILRQYANCVRFNRKGNVVTIVRRF